MEARSEETVNALAFIWVTFQNSFEPEKCEQQRRAAQFRFLNHIDLSIQKVEILLAHTITIVPHDL